MPLPRRRCEDKVKVIPLAQAFKIPGTAGIALRLWLSGLDSPLLNPGDFVLDDVADGLDLNTLDLEEIAYMG
jgi:hypothetical protein